MRYDMDDEEEEEEETHAPTSTSYPNVSREDQFPNFSTMIQQPSSSSSNDVRMARNALEASRLKNSSSQWLYNSYGSRSF